MTRRRSKRVCNIVISITLTHLHGFSSPFYMSRKGKDSCDARCWLNNACARGIVLTKIRLCFTVGVDGMERISDVSEKCTEDVSEEWNGELWSRHHSKKEKSRELKTVVVAFPRTD